MALDQASLDHFNEIIELGDWHQERADELVNENLLRDAKVHYSQAAKAYRTAMGFAKRHGDYDKAEEALELFNICLKKSQQMYNNPSMF